MTEQQLILADLQQATEELAALTQEIQQLTSKLAALQRDDQLSTTRGGPNQAVAFQWSYDQDDRRVNIKNANGRTHQYALTEIVAILQYLSEGFGHDFFPLANNVALLGNGEEVPGLGQAIMHVTPGNVTHGQGAGYLGVVLEEIGYFEWNGAHNGIKWRIVSNDLSREALERALVGPRHHNEL